MYALVWSRVAAEYEGTSGDALTWLKERPVLDHDIFDIDPYSLPYEAIALVGQRATKDRIGLVCTDGCLRREAQRRANLPQFVQEACGWPRRDHTLMASIDWQYPRFLRFVLGRILPDFEIEALALKVGRGIKSRTVYFAAGLKRKGCTS